MTTNEEIEKRIAGRACGECRACCTGMGVNELDKDPGVACQHLCATGCDIYTGRPASCRDYYCLWRMGVGRLMERPDRVGYFLDVTDKNGQLGQLMVAREAWPGAFDSAEVNARLGKLSDDKLVIKVRGNERKLIGPEQLVRKAQQKIQIVERRR